MNVFCRSLMLFLLIPSLYAAGEPLNTSAVTNSTTPFVTPSSALPTVTIAIERFIPPFVIQGSQQKIYGYDISMMNSLCRIINRNCQFKIMKFNEIINAVTQQKVDAAISAITITAERAKIVNFSLPYLLSNSRFLTKYSSDIKSFSLLSLKGKKIGVETGSVFPDQIQQMGIIDPIIKEYSNTNELLEGLRSSEVDFLLLDNPTAVYWEANSSGAFMAVGAPYMYGFGLGIAVAPNEKELLKSINAALLQYQNSNEYKQNYDTYLQQF